MMIRYSLSLILLIFIVCTICNGCSKPINHDKQTKHLFAGEWVLTKKVEKFSKTVDIPQKVIVLISKSQLPGEADVTCESLVGFGSVTTSYSNEKFSCETIYHKLLFYRHGSKLEMKLYMRNLDEDFSEANNWHLIAIFCKK